jgi:hypothetical protein
MIAKVKQGYQVLSSKGKNLGGPYQTLEEAKKRLRQVEFFKHRKGSRRVTALAISHRRLHLRTGSRAK